MSGFSLISFFFLLYQEIVQTQFGSRIGGGNNTDDSDDDQGDIELSFGNKDTFVLEVRLQLFFFLIIISIAFNYMQPKFT